MIGHLDADCFYVSCERVRHPHLRGVPVSILGNWGACCIAKSYEAKARGVKTGMPIWEAMKVCPEGVYVKRDFQWYEILSRKMLGLVKEISPKVEYYSIDESFFDASDLKDPEQAAKDVQQRILTETGIPITIGIAPTRSLAKLVSDSAKPFGCRVLRDGFDDFLAALPVVDITGIAQRSAVKLAQHGIKTCLDFIRADRNFICNLLTIKGERLWWELRGEPVDPILEERPAHKAISRGGSLGGSSDDPARLVGWAARNTERLVDELEYHQVFTNRIVLLLEFKDHTGWGRGANLVEPSNRFDVILSVVKRLMSLVGDRGAWSYMHIVAEKLCRTRNVQLSLFHERTDDSMDQLKRDVNGKVGRFALRSGDTLALDDVYADEACDYDICDIRGKTCF